MMIKTLKQVLILDYSDLDFSHKGIKNLADHTVNTWQPYRTKVDKVKDTALGKLAEEVIVFIFNQIGIEFYHSYDSFRIDKFENHAPFDGVFAQELNNDIVKFINQNIIEHGAKLNSETRNKLRENNIYTIEIKSTRSTQKYREKANFISYDEPESVARLVELLLSYDFISYPFYKRIGDFSFYEYSQYVGNKLGLKEKGNELETQIINIELQNACDFYVRVFIDEDYKKIFVMGFITKEELLIPPRLIKLYQKNKSEKSIYFSKTIKQGHSILTIKDFVNFDAESVI